jgi:hypothetical protein
VKSASTTISLEAVSTAFAKPVGVYADITNHLIFDG